MFHPTQEKLVDILTAQTQNSSRLFFRLVVSYTFCKLASMMRTSIDIQGRDIFPINMYVVNLANSGSGKGHSVSILEDQVVNNFREEFLERTFPALALTNISKLSVKRANKNNTDPDSELDNLNKEFKEAGEMVFAFDSATTPAVKQMRHKLLLASSGSINLEIDEVGSNLLSNVDVLTTFLELFDLGKVKQKLIKNTRENARVEQLFGSTPTNMLLFGTPNKLLDGNKVEDEFNSMLEIGFARRCFFGLSRSKAFSHKYTPEEVYDIFTDVNSANYLLQLSSDFRNLADINNYGAVLRMSKPVTMKWIAYKLKCEEEAITYNDYDEIRKAELTHRHFKVAKLAGAYAFIDMSMEVTEDHLKYAISLADESGKALENILRRERPYVKLARYICSSGRESTQADLIEDLPFYKGSEAQRRDMMTLAISHAYQKHQVIRVNKMEGIEVFSGENIKETNLDELIISYSKHSESNYISKEVPWDKLHQLTQQDSYHWVNHFLEDEQNKDGTSSGGYRDDAHCIKGFNLIILDVDGTASMDLVTKTMEDYKWLLYTTKSHTPENHRFRLILPSSNILKLNGEDYKEFMRSVFTFLPFEVDTQTGQRSRKWLTNKGFYQYNDGKIFDVIPFIPKTRKAQEYTTNYRNQTNLSALERWCVNQAQESDRNNTLFKYAAILMDMGLDIDSIRNNVLALNAKFPNPLEETEIMTSIIVSISKKIGLKVKT